MHDINKNNYAEYVKNKTKKSPLGRNLCLAFLIGGGICVVGEGVRQLLIAARLPQESAKIWVSIGMIFLGALFTGLGLYDKLAKIAGAGTVIPITGFANSIVSSAMEFKKEGWVLGVGAKMFTIAGPVLVYGITASVVYGIIYWCFLLFR